MWKTTKKFAADLGHRALVHGTRILPPPDFGAEELAVIKAVGKHTMTSPERLYALIHATRYIVTAGIAGSVAECGVWRGGSMMAVALTLLKSGQSDRDLYLFDTFEGMVEPETRDTSVFGQSATAVFRRKKTEEDRSTWCLASVEDVTEALASTGYDSDRIHLVKGKVEETIPDQAPGAIALLRLDTDWYESTRHELIHLYPRLASGGVLIIDDYGHWKGCREAVDEYLAENDIKILLNRIDYTGRIAIKP